mgnify:FL=1
MLNLYETLPTIMALRLQRMGMAAFLCLSSGSLGPGVMDRARCWLPAGASLHDRRYCLDPVGGFEALAASTEDMQVLLLSRGRMEGPLLQGTGLEPSVRIQSSGSKKKTGLRGRCLSTLCVWWR